ncbi:MAG: hypothetical protein K6D54_04400 [Bacteroidales bacterium]|nr:hypothetical protein [Bacteroidales bacterium]
MKNDGTLTKGLAIGDGDTEAATTVLKSIWKAGDKVHVFLGERYVGELTAAPDEQDPHFATLWGMVTTAGIKPGVSSLTLLTPRREWDYTGQNGKLLATDDPENSIESKYHYTMASNVPVTSAIGGVITTETATFRNQQSIYRMSFRYQKGGVGAQSAINVKEVNISGSGAHLVRHYELDNLNGTVVGDILVTLPEASTNPFFVAVCDEYAQGNEEVFTFTVVDGDGATYRGSKTIPGEYNNNGSFVSMKNTTLNYRLEMNLNSSSVDTVL